MVSSSRDVRSKHSLDQFVDLILSVAPDTTSVVRVSLGGKALQRRGELEWPEEVVCLLEVGAESGDFVDEVLNTCNTVLAKNSFDDLVVSQRDSGSVDLAISSLVNELSDGGLRWVAIGNVWLNASEHVDCGLVQSDKDSVVQLSQSEELKDLLVLGVKVVDTRAKFIIK